MANFLVTYLDKGNCPIEEHTEEIEADDFVGVINQLYEDSDDSTGEHFKFFGDTHKITIEHI